MTTAEYHPCRARCGMMLHRCTPGDYCEACTASNAGDLERLVALADDDNYSRVARELLYDGFGMNDEDRAAYLAHHGRRI